MIKKNINILIVGQYFWPENFRINEISQYLGLDPNMNVFVLTGKPNYPQGKFFKGYKFWGVIKEYFQGITIFRVPVIPRGNGSALMLTLNYFSFLLFSCSIGIFLVRKTNPNILLVYATSPILQAIPAIIISKLFRAPLMLYVQDIWPESVKDTGFIKNKFILNAIEKLVKFIYKNSEIILVQSEGFIPKIRKLCQNADVRFLPNSVFENDEAYSQYSKELCSQISNTLKGNSFNVVIAGNIGKAQSPQTILDASEILKNASKIKITIVGSGSSLNFLKEQSKLRDIHNIQFLGRLPAPYLKFVYEKSSILLLTLEKSPIFSLTIPNRLQSYLAAGKPIVAAVDGEAKKILKKSKAGISVPSSDPVALANAILKISDMKEKDLKKMGENGKNYFKLHFDHFKLMDILKKWVIGAVK